MSPPQKGVGASLLKKRGKYKESLYYAPKGIPPNFKRILGTSPKDGRGLKKRRGINSQRI